MYFGHIQARLPLAVDEERQTCQLVSNLASIVEQGSQVQYGKAARPSCSIIPYMPVVDAPSQQQTHLHPSNKCDQVHI